MSWLLNDGVAAVSNYAARALDAMRQADTRALVPVIWSVEVANVIAKAETKGLINEAQSEAFLEMLTALDIDVDSESSSKALSETLQLARRHRLSAYDASYLELSLRSGFALATLDKDLAKAAKKAGASRFDVLLGDVLVAG